MVEEPDRPAYGNGDGAQVNALDVIAEAKELDRALLAWRQWRGQPTPTIRHAGNDALEAIDILLGYLIGIRTGVVREIQEVEAANARRMEQVILRTLAAGQAAMAARA
jgi:hypothetical protein